jgi:hypothetical protein
MTTYEIRPRDGLGPVRFGMSRAEVHAALDEPPEPYQKTPEARHAADAFQRAGLHVHYRGAEPVVEFIEGFAVPDVRLTLRDVHPLEVPAEEVVARLAGLTDVIEEEDGATYVLPEWDVSLRRPDRAHERFTAVGVAEPGYSRLAVV